MKTLKRQSIAQSVREGIIANIENYPTQSAAGGVYPTDDAICSLSSWIENEYAVDEDIDKGTIEEWKEICIDEFIDVLELQDGDYDETNTVLNRINEELEDLK